MIMTWQINTWTSRTWTDHVQFSTDRSGCDPYHRGNYSRRRNRIVKEDKIRILSVIVTLHFCMLQDVLIYISVQSFYNTWFSSWFSVHASGIGTNIKTSTHRPWGVSLVSLRLLNDRPHKTDCPSWFINQHRIKKEQRTVIQFLIMCCTWGYS